MQRFKNILVVYDFFEGCDDTLQKAVDLAIRNAARLTVVHASNAQSAGQITNAERERLLKRVEAGLPLPDAQRSSVVCYGPPVERILEAASGIGADLIIAPEQNKGFYAQILGLDISTELLRQANCPTWIMRPQQGERQPLIIAALNAGKPDAPDCQANRRILEISSSLSILEGAELHLVYAWDFEGGQRDTIASELPRGKHEALCAEAHATNRGKIVSLVKSVLTDFVDYKAMPLRGNPRSAIVDYANEQNAALLIFDGQVDGAIKSALGGNTTTYLARHAASSVLCTRPACGYANAGALDAA